MVPYKNDWGFWHFLICALLFLPVSNYGQDDDDYLYMKDGIILGVKSELVEDCMGFIGDDITANEEERKVLCNCMMESFSKNYTHKEYMELLDKDESDLIFLYTDKTSSLYQDMMGCFISKLEILYPERKFNTSMSKEVFMEGCINSIRTNNLLYNYNIDEQIYCNCVKDQFLSHSITELASDNIFDINSVLHNEVFAPCFNIIEPPNLSAEVNSLDNSNLSNSIALLKYGTAYKVKASIGDFTKYFTLDTGAEDLFISEEFMQELKSNGLLNSDVHLGEAYYSLADESIIKCQKFLVREITIGEYTINNVEATVINSDIQFLIGSSILVRFSQWSIDNRNLKLTLYK